MSLSFIIDGQLVGGSSKSFSLSDPGGCESATIEKADAAVRPGAKVLILDNSQPLWLGRVEEPGVQEMQPRPTTSSIGATGLIAKLSESRMAEIFIERSLAKFTPPTSARTVTKLAAGEVVGEFEVSYDLSFGPSIRTRHNDSASRQNGVEFDYDAGVNCKVQRVVYSHIGINPEAASAFARFLYSSDRSTFSTCSSSGTNDTLSATVVETRDLAFKASRFLTYQYIYPLTAGLSPELDRVQVLYNLCIIGDHGLPVDGAASNTKNELHLKLGRIVEHAVKRSGLDGQLLIDVTNIPVYSLTYADLVAPRQVIDDAVKLSGFHFGVWPGLLTDPYSPVTMFQAPPKRPSASVAYADCREPDIVERYSGMNRQAKVSYTLGETGESQGLIVTRDHPRLPVGEGGTLEVDAGTVGSITIAQTYGLMALAADQIQSRAAGSVTLPAMVTKDTGSLMPSHHLRPGIDRLRITGLPNTAKLIGDDTERADTFRISRLTVTEDANGIQTAVELDQGADLIEVLQAKFGAVDPTGQLGG